MIIKSCKPFSFTGERLIFIQIFTMPKPAAGTYPVYFDNYISKVEETDVITAIENQQPVVDSFFNSISEEKSMFAYAPGKWTLKELLQHIIDAERIFCFRALCFARAEKQSLPGFEEDDYARNSNANARSWESLLKEMKVVRQSSRLLYESFSNEMLESSGLANNNPTSVNAIGFILVGHLTHHVNIIKERYL
ncbi:MAG: hypothetical protein JWQ27_129 [Ferruginibacter sp.]|nr:hypothetical protein [Ferruginibacter sp.]